MIDEIDELMADLAAAQAGGRDPLDRYREFRQVFLGTDAGKRVLHDILAWGHLFRSSIVRESDHMTYAREGERNLALKVLTAIHMEPKPRPTEQRLRPEGD